RSHRDVGPVEQTLGWKPARLETFEEHLEDLAGDFFQPFPQRRIIPDRVTPVPPPKTATVSPDLSRPSRSARAICSGLLHAARLAVKAKVSRNRARVRPTYSCVTRRSHTVA